MDALHNPLALRCGLEMSQRIAMAPLTNTQSNSDGSLAEDEFRWLTRRARDGFRWISTCASFVSEQGHAWQGQLGIANESHEPGLTRLATGIKQHGATAVVQLHHAGAKATLAPDRPLSTVDGGPNHTRAANRDDIDQVIADFVAAALRAERAGFDGVEIHGANGYLFTQFLAPADNPRTDDYGGALVGRARFLREAMQAVRSAVSASFAVGVRLSPVDVWDKRGLVLADGVQVAKWLVEDGVDFIHLSLKEAAAAPTHETDNQPVARAFRDALPPDVPIFAAGGMWTRDDARAALDAGVDVVVLGRSAIAHPDWPVVSARADWEPVRPTWSQEFLRSVDVGESLMEYLCRFPGMVEGGTEART